MSYKPKYPLAYGPFSVKKVTSSEMLLTKVDKYPEIEKISVDKIHIYKDTGADALWLQIKSGNTDLQSCGAPKDVVDSIVNSNPDITHMAVPRFWIVSLFMNNDFYPFNEVKFRQALAYVIDRPKARTIGSYYADIVEYVSGIVPIMVDKWIFY